MSQQTENYNFNLIETTDKITDSLNDLNDNFESLDDILSSISAISFEIVQTLPVTGESGIIYLVPNSGSGENVYDEYIWINNAFELIGSTAIDLSDYYTKSQVDTKLEEKAEKSEVDMITSNNTKTSTKSTALNLTDSLNGLIKDTVIYGNTEQDDTPTPSNPVDVEVVTGDVTLNVTGKNLVDTFKTNSAITNSGLTYLRREDGSIKITGTTNRAWDYILTTSMKFLAGKTYTFKVRFTNDSTPRNFYILFNSTNGGQLTANLTNNYTTKRTIVQDQTLNVKLSLGANIATNFDCTIQIEESSTATAYETYKGQSQLLSLGNIELAKIGDYQDYIYKSGDKWYKHKAVEKIASYNGETISTTYMSTTGELSTGSTVYYGLTTTAEVEITDTTLIAQLEALYNLKTYKPITNVYTTTQNLSPELTIDYEAEQYIKNNVINEIWKGTQTEYDNLSTYSDTTLYLIEEE